MTKNTATSSEGSGIVTGNLQQNSARASRKGFIRVAIALLVVAGVGLTAWRVLIYESPYSIEKLSTQYDEGGAAKNPKKTLADLSKVNEAGMSSTELARLYHLRGQAYQTKGDSKAALDAYEKSLAHDSSQRALYLDIAEEATKSGNYDKAVIYYEKAIAWLKSNPNAEDPMQESYIQTLEIRLERAKRENNT